MSDSNPRFTTRIVAGVAVIALGVLFTLDNVGVAPAGELLKWWPVLLIAYGMTRLAGLGCGRSWISGSLWLLAGTWLLFEHLGLVHGSLWQLWPLMFVCLGIGIIQRGSWGPRVYGINTGRFGRRRRRYRRMYGMDEAPNIAYEGGTGPDAGAPGGGNIGTAGDTGAGSADDEHDDREWKRTDTSSHFNVDVFMGSVSRRVAAQQFKRGDVDAVMGGGDIDMRSARMAEATARLEVNLIMGGVNLYVPEDWSVEYQGTPIMGSVEDHSRRPAGEPKGRLIITGVLVMSSIIIKN